MGAFDPYVEYDMQLSSPGVDFVPVTPSDSTDLAEVTRYIHVTGTGGIIYVTTLKNSQAAKVPVYVAQGGILPCRVSRIWATGTTATGISAVY